MLVIYRLVIQGSRPTARLLSEALLKIVVTVGVVLKHLESGYIQSPIQGPKFAPITQSMVHTGRVRP